MNPHTPMTPLRPYLVKAMLDWINANQMRPHVLVDATVEGVQVPARAIIDGRVVLNLAERAVAYLTLDDHELRFSTRFGGVEERVVLPLSSLVAVYAQETGVGMNFPPEGVATPPAPPEPPKDRRAHLRVVK